MKLVLWNRKNPDDTNTSTDASVSGNGGGGGGTASTAGGGITASSSFISDVENHSNHQRQQQQQRGSFFSSNNSQKAQHQEPHHQQEHPQQHLKFDPRDGLMRDQSVRQVVAEEKELTKRGSQFHSYAREVSVVSNNNAIHAIEMLNGIATTITAQGEMHRSMSLYHEASMALSSSTAAASMASSSDTTIFPNVTISYFHQRAREIVESPTSGIEMVLYLPIVEEHNKVGWEYYMTNETSSHEDISQTDRRGIFHTEIVPCESCENLVDNRLGFQNRLQFMEDILEDYGYEAEELSVPVAQYGPLPDDDPTDNSYTNDTLTMVDLFAHPIFKKEFVTSLEYGVPILSEAIDLEFLLNHIHTENTMSPTMAPTIILPERRKKKAARITVGDEFRSFIATPVKESFGENGAESRTVGFVVGIVRWSSFFTNALTGMVNTHVNTSDYDHAKTSEATTIEEDSDDGIVAKIVSDCGNSFTYVLNRSGKNVPIIGEYQGNYERYERTLDVSDFLLIEHSKGKSRHCHFDLHLRPTNEFFKAYHDQTNLVYAGLVLTVILFTAAMFYVYDSFIFERQRAVVSQATTMVIENARQAAKNERDLNDFIAHEVRNPLAAALTACSFVSTALLGTPHVTIKSHSNKASPMANPNVLSIESSEKRKLLEDDIQILDSSLHFMNDLLGNMLDMQRANSNQLTIETKPTQILDDIFVPTSNMLHVRGSNFKVELKCPENLCVITDPLRLKQIMLNLARNSVKFVEHGFIRLAAKTIMQPNGSESIELSVEDSGVGIPPEKREALFEKFQESLDSLNQGNGIGLNLCKKLTDLMGANLYIDYQYHSGIPGYPGTRFVVDLNQQPIVLDDDKLSELSESFRTSTSLSRSTRYTEGLKAPVEFDNSNLCSIEGSDVSDSEDELSEEELPDTLSVLFVDDDMVLRKLFSRSIKKTMPNWSVKEAANGETALEIVKENDFDLIFLDQYMASVQKQLLGTETAQALRAQGVNCIIWGLSANDVEKAFYEAGADGFMFKPFPFKPDLLKLELLRILRVGKSRQLAVPPSDVLSISDTTKGNNKTKRSSSISLSSGRHVRMDMAGELPCSPGEVISVKATT